MIVCKSQHVPIFGFGPHVDLTLRQQALTADCDAVVGRGAVATQLPHPVEKHKMVKLTNPRYNPLR